MAGRIIIYYWIILDIGISIPALRIGRARNNTIRLEEAVNIRRTRYAPTSKNKLLRYGTEPKAKIWRGQESLAEPSDKTAQQDQDVCHEVLDLRRTKAQNLQPDNELGTESPLLTLTKQLFKLQVINSSSTDESKFASIWRPRGRSNTIQIQEFYIATTIGSNQMY